jgi:hypothetical protein
MRPGPGNEIEQRLGSPILMLLIRSLNRKLMRWQLVDFASEGSPPPAISKGDTARLLGLRGHPFQEPRVRPVLAWNLEG